MNGNTRNLYDAKNFKQLCVAKFQFLLTDYGFVRRQGLSVKLAQNVPFVNKTTFVAIGFDKRDSFINVDIAPVVSGRRDIDYAFDPNRFSLAELLSLRAPDVVLYPYIGDWRPMYDREIEEVLDNSANALKKYAHDTLKGDFNALPIIQGERARRRIARNI